MYILFMRIILNSNFILPIQAIQVFKPYFYVRIYKYRANLHNNNITFKFENNLLRTTSKELNTFFFNIHIHNNIHAVLKFNVENWF